MMYDTKRLLSLLLDTLLVYLRYTDKYYTSLILERSAASKLYTSTYIHVILLLSVQHDSYGAAPPLPRPAFRWTGRQGMPSAFLLLAPCRSCPLAFYGGFSLQTAHASVGACNNKAACML
jgi:hypothetical protein